MDRWNEKEAWVDFEGEGIVDLYRFLVITKNVDQHSWGNKNKTFKSLSKKYLDTFYFSNTSLKI